MFNKIKAQQKAYVSGVKYSEEIYILSNVKLFEVLIFVEISNLTKLENGLSPTLLVYM